MNTGHTFKRHILSADQRLWLEEVARAAPAFSPRATRIALRGRLAPGFSPDTIDPRLYANRRLTPIGLWLIDPKNPQFEAIDETIKAVRERILQKPDLKTITAGEIAADTGMTERQVGEALFAAGELDTHFFSSAEGVKDSPAVYAKLHMPDDDSADDAYLDYTNVEDLLESFYTRRGEALGNALLYSQHQRIRMKAPEQTPAYSEEAARSICAAIANCLKRDGRAHVGNVPREAETILLDGSGAAMDTAEASRQVQRAIVGLSQEGRIEIAAERHRDWRILKPLQSESSMSNQRVFIVHGHNGEAKEAVARFVEKLRFEAIILHERPNEGRTIIAKFQEESTDAGFAVVLMTPDDEGRAVNATATNYRARQNVVFELGFFIGKLGPKRVAALVKGDIERPSDFDGVVYISLDQADWPVRLATEFKKAGLAADWSRILS